MSEHVAADWWRIIGPGFWQCDAENSVEATVLMRTSTPVTSEGAPSEIVAPEARSFMRVPMWWRFHEMEDAQGAVGDILWRPAGYTIRRATEHARAHALHPDRLMRDCAECLRVCGPESDLTTAELCAELTRLRASVGEWMHYTSVADAELKRAKAR
jgi:hypothetical protein